MSHRGRFDVLRVWSLVVVRALDRCACRIDSFVPSIWLNQYSQTCHTPHLKVHVNIAADTFLRRISANGSLSSNRAQARLV